jgi:2-polyprenyl-3-methyl-5-hydroxy-6-metoxy-1,4-benzoquinol methylase
MKGDLTDRSYWADKQRGSRLVNPRRLDVPDWFPIAEPFLKRYEGKLFIELGCSPGTMSAMICNQINFIPYGIDFSPQACLYIENMKRVGYEHAQLIPVDVREYGTDMRFDVVASFGLVEHFENPTEILFHHDRLVKRHGLVIVVMPNFRYVQWLYHFLFDRNDLVAHNLRTMNLDVLRKFSMEYKYEILFLAHYGRMNFWGVDLRGLKVTAQLRRLAARVVRDISHAFASRCLPLSSKYTSPWIVYVGKKL